jgi:hypothetical protein
MIYRVTGQSITRKRRAGLRPAALCPALFPPVKAIGFRRKFSSIPLFSPLFPLFHAICALAPNVFEPHATPARSCAALDSTVNLNQFLTLRQTASTIRTLRSRRSQSESIFRTREQVPMQSPTHPLQNSHASGPKSELEKTSTLIYFSLLFGRHIDGILKFQRPPESVACRSNIWYLAVSGWWLLFRLARPKTAPRGVVNAIRSNS